MKNIIRFINVQTGFKTIMCCCGHKKSIPPSLIVVDVRAGSSRIPFDIFSGVQFKQNQKRFYKKDKQGYYYIPEVKKLKK